MTEQPLDLDLIEARAAHLYEYPAHADDVEILAGTEVPALLAEVRRLRARIWEELERPATETERNALRQSFMELAAQCEQDRDYEGAFDAQCRLREREEQWATEDAARPVAPSAQPAVEASETCGKCKQSFDPADTSHVEGSAQYGETAWCRRCVSRCHDSTDFAHACPVCDPTRRS